MPTMEDVTKLRQLELGWNDKIRIEKESRRILTMGEDIRDFLNSSMGLNTPNVGGMSPEGFQATHTGEYTDSPENDAVRTKEGLSPMKGGGMLEIDGEARKDVQGDAVNLCPQPCTIHQLHICQTIQTP